MTTSDGPDNVKPLSPVASVLLKSWIRAIEAARQNGPGNNVASRHNFGAILNGIPSSKTSRVRTSSENLVSRPKRRSRNESVQQNALKRFKTETDEDTEFTDVPDDLAGLNAKNAAESSASMNVDASAKLQDNEIEKARSYFQRWDEAPQRVRLLILVQLFKRLDTVLGDCVRKTEVILGAKSEGLKLMDLGHLRRLLTFARNAAPYVRGPPEYNDPTGTDPLCVPGYSFPCPDRVMMLKSALFHAHLVRAIPPDIKLTPDTRTRAMYWIHLKSETPEATVYFSLNSTGSWKPFRPQDPPFLTGPGTYIVRAYCTAAGFLTSEVSVAEISVPGPDGAELASQSATKAGFERSDSAIVSKDSKPLESSTTKDETLRSSLVSKFGGLFLTAEASDDDADDDDISEESG